MQATAKAGASAVSFLDRLTQEERAVLLAGARMSDFNDSAVIVAQGDATTDAFLLIEGRAMFASYAQDGRLVQLREIGPGSIFGEFAAIDGAPRTADVVSIGRSRVARIGREALFLAIEKAPGIGRLLLRHLVEVIRNLGERIHEQTTLQVRERLLRELLRLGRPLAGGSDRAVLAPSPTHAVLAANIGTHREAVTKQLSMLGRLGLVRKVEGGLLLPSLRAVEREAERVDGRD